MRGLIFAVKLGPVPGFSGGSEYSVTPGGLSAWGCVYPRGSVCLGGCVPRGVSAGERGCVPRGVSTRGVWQTPPCEQNHRHV